MKPPTYAGQTIEVNGDIFATPFATLWAPLQPKRRVGLFKTIESEGVLSEVWWYTSPAWGKSIIDGLNRCEIALTLGLKVRLKEFKGITDEQALEFAKIANRDRRQSTEKQIGETDGKRLIDVITLRREGRSTRAIAEAVGVSQRQVRRDLDKAEPAGESPVSPAGTIDTNGTTAPAKVTGRDGKAYPAAKPRAATIPITLDPPPAPDLPPVPAARPAVPPSREPLSLFQVLEIVRGGTSWVWAGDVCRLIDQLGLSWSEIERRAVVNMKLRESVSSESPATGPRAAEPGEFPKLEPLVSKSQKDMLKRNRDAAKGTPPADKVVAALARRKAEKAAGSRDESPGAKP